MGLTIRTGLGGVRLRGAPGIDLDSDHSGYLTAGPGATFPLGTGWGIRGDVRARYSHHDPTPDGGYLYLDWTVGPYFEF